MGTVRVFRHHIHTAFLWLATVEFLAGIGAIYLGSYVRFEGDIQDAERQVVSLMTTAVVFSILLLISMGALGMYQPHMREGSSGQLIRSLSAMVVLVFMVSVLFYLVPTISLWRGALGLSLLFAFVFVASCRAIFARVIDEERLKRRVLVFGAGRNAQLMLERLRRKSDRRGFLFVGFISVPGEGDLVDADQLIKIDGSICDYASANHIDEIVVAVDDRRRGLPINDLLDCKLNGIAVMDLVGFFERETGRIMLEFVTPGWMVFSDGFQFGNVRSLSKRIFDLVASFVLLMATWPIMLITVIAIWLEDGFRAPVVYRQKRVGVRGQPFDLLKFRSMCTDAEKEGEAVWAQKNDSRVTRVGRFIRKCRIDELPQIINVLSGDMGFVGPRPERPQFVNELTQRIPHYAARHQVKPGIAGWAQLCYPYGSDEKDAEQKLQFDLYYVKNNSLFLDFLILVGTVEVVLMGKGAR